MFFLSNNFFFFFFFMFTLFVFCFKSENSLNFCLSLSIFCLSWQILRKFSLHCKFTIKADFVLFPFLQFSFLAIKLYIFVSLSKRNSIPLPFFAITLLYLIVIELEIISWILRSKLLGKSYLWQCCRLA